MSADSQEAVVEPATFNVGGIRFPRPFKLRRFGHFGFYHVDHGGAARFYVEELGLRLTDAMGLNPGDPPEVYFTSHGADHHAVVHVNARHAVHDPRHYPEMTVNQISFQVGSLKEISDAYHYCVANDIPVQGVGRDFPGSNWALYIYAPDNYVIELFYGMEQIGWQRESKPRDLYVNGPIFLDPHAVPALPQKAEFAEILEIEARQPLPKGHRDIVSMPYDFDVGGVRLQRPFIVNKVGPCSLFVEDVAASEEFYIRHLGLERTEEVVWNGHRCVFLRSGAEHHTVALIPIAVRDAIGFDPTTRLMSLGIELGSYQQLKDARDFLAARGLKLIHDVPAALRPGIDYAFYVRDPSGHALMLYYYMEQLGWDGMPRPASLRREIEEPWPDVLDPLSDTFMDQVLQGPLN